MAPATPSRALPRSKANPSASTVAASTTATLTPEAHQEPHRDWRVPEDPDFVHPDHVVPPRSYRGTTDLIIVCAHAIFLPDAKTPEFPLQSPHYEPNWLLASFQASNSETGKPGEHETFLAHVKAGIDALTIGTDQEHPPSGLLVLSGGATKRSQTHLSEARSYYHAALAEELGDGHLHGGRAHRMYSKGYILLEERATDSFQNLLFSILLFRQTTGVYPRHIRIITHAFKAKRFLELHAPTIRWPKERVQVQGIDPVMSSAELESTLQGEERHGYAPWKDDPTGVGNLLSGKRKQRGWEESVIQQVLQGLELESGIKELLSGANPGRLPWEQLHADE